MTTSSDRMIDGLVENLTPIRRNPSLRQAFALLFSVWAVLLGVTLWTQEGEIGLRSVLFSRLYAAVLVGLSVAAFGGLISALAAGIPGRRPLEIIAMGFSLSGWLAALTACGVGLIMDGRPGTPSPAGFDLWCLRSSLKYAVLPAVVILILLVRGWVGHPSRAAIIALVSAGAMGSLIVHASCTFVAPGHFLVSHLTVPVLLAVLGVVPVALLLRRSRG